MRSSTDRWLALSILVSKVETCFEATAWLDAYGGSAAVAMSSQAVDHRLRTLGDLVARHADKLTCELLDAELARQKRREAA